MKVIERTIKTDVSIKIPVGWITRISLGRAPNLTAAIAITGKRGWPSGGITGRIDGMTRARLSKHQTVRIQNEPAKICRLQNFIQPWSVSTFGEPKAGGIRAKGGPISIATDEHLGARRIRR